MELDKNPPNARDPLSEPTFHRRVWAAYLSRGFNRAEFARLLGANYNAVQNWDHGKNEMSLHTFAEAVPLLGYSADELLFGKRRGSENHTNNGVSRSLRAISASTINGSFASPEASPVSSLNSSTFGEAPSEALEATKDLSPSAIRNLVEAIGASPEATEALKITYTSKEHCWLDHSENFVRHFVKAYDSSKKLRPDARLLAAVNTATNAAARLKAIALDGHEPRVAPPPPPPRQRKRTPVNR